MALRWSMILVCSTLLSSVLAGPVTDSTQCATQCPASTKFSYTPGQTYIYTYESDVKTSVAGATEEHSSLHIRASAQFEVISPCEMSLTLTDVTLLDSNPASFDDRQNVEKIRDFKNALQQRPLRFAFLDGTIENVCPDPAEKSWVLNIKKGVISALQNTMLSLSDPISTRETDVTGDCPVQYEALESSKGSTKISKTKNLLACNDRHGYDAFFQATPYRVPSNIQSMPLMKTSHECTQEIDKNRIISSSSCQEKHTFRPFAKQHNGATTEVTYKLTFSKKISGTKTRIGPIQNRSTLLFDHTKSDDQLTRDISEAQTILESLCSTTQVDVRPETPGLFAKLVRKMRQLDTASLRTLHQKASASKCVKAKKFFYDAVPLLGSTASVALAKDLIQRGALSDPEIGIWLTSIAFISNPTPELISEAQGLLDAKAYRKAALAVSSLVHTYCMARPSCETEAVVQAITKVFETNLRYNCRADNPQDHDSIIASLKAFGNLGFAGSSKAVIDRCITNEELPIEVRVTAINAYRRMTCSLERVELMKIFTNTRLDAELRIGAYLSVIPCADESIIRRVKEVLESETANQVGSFVWTHMTNLLETSSPLKQSISDIIENVDLKREFDLDKRKFSRNIEWSLFSEMMNTGAAVESNLIWSEDSYIPRSTSLNLTVDVFGHSMNLLEIGTRFQGLEKIIEQFAQQNQENTIPSGINQFDQQYKVPQDKTQASYYMRVFGNEIRYGDFHDWDPSTMKDKFNFLDFMIDLANDHNIDVTKSLMFLDASIAIPTVVGLPLTLSVDGTSSTSVKVKGKMDIRQLFTRPSNFDITGSISPSAAVEVEGLMGVDAFVARTGLRMVTTLHTSTVVDGQIQMQEGKLLNIDFNMPRDRIEILNVESKFYVTYRGNERAQQMITDDKFEKSGCYTELSTVLGVEFCGEVALPQAIKQETAPWFPFSGPAKAKVYINKVDSHTGYHFDMKYNQEKRKISEGFSITDLFTTSMDTPGSKVNRKMTAEFTLKRDEKSIRLAVTSPWKKIEITGDGKYDDSIKRIATKLNIDGSNAWSIVAELKTEDSKKTGLTYMPNVEIITTMSRPITLKGMIAYKEGRRADVDMALALGSDSIMTCKGNIQKTIEAGKANQGSVKYDVNLDVDVAKYMKGKITGFYKNGMEEVRTYSTRFVFEYSMDNRRPERLTLSGKLRDKSQGNTIQYIADGSFANSIYPKNDVDFTVDVAKGPGALSLTLDSGLDKVRRFKMSASTNYVIGNDNKVTAQVNFELPSEKWQANAALDHAHSSSQVKTSLSGKLNAHEGAIELSSKRAFKPLKLGTDVKVRYPGREITIAHTIDERNPTEYGNRLSIQYDKNAKVELNGVYKMKPRHEIAADLSYPGNKISVMGFINPDIKNMQSHAEVSVAKSKYATDLNWLLEPSKFSSDAKVIIPSRTVTAAAEITRNGKTLAGSIATKWNADKDESQKAAIGGQITLSTQTPALQINAEWYPKQYINFATNGKIESGNWYKASPDVEAKMQFKSSFKGVEDVSSNFVYDISTNGLKTNGEVMWAADKKLGTDFELKYGKDSAELIANAKTPFAGYKTLKASSSYKWQKNKLDTNLEASWEAKKISLATSSSLDIAQHSLQGRAILTTPFSGFELTEISVKHKDNGATFNSNIDVSWSKGQKASAAFKMDHQANSKTFANKGEISLSGPFRVFKTAKTSWDTQILSSNVRIHAEIEADKQRGIFDVQGAHQLTGNTRKINISGSLTSPVTNFESISITYNRESDISSWKSMKSEASVQWAAGKAISFSHEMTMNFGNAYRYKMALTTPFRTYEKIAADFNTEISGTTYSIRNEVSRGNQKIGLEGKLSLNGYEFDGTARFTSPFKPVTSIVTNVKNTKTGNTWKSHYDLEYAPSKKIEVDTEVGLKDNIKLGFSLKTPFSQAQKVAGSVSFMGNARNFDTSFEAEHNMLDKKLTGNLKVDVAALPTIKVALNVVTPFRELSFIRYSFSHKLNGKTTYITESKFEMPQYSKITTHELNLKSAKNFNTKSVTEIKSGVSSQKFEVATQFQWSNSLTIRTTLKTPYEGFEEMSANFAQDGTLKNWRVNAEAIKGVNKITLNSEFIMSDSSTRGTLRLTTPFTKVQKVEATFLHTGSLPTLKNTVAIQINDDKYSIENELNIQKGSIKALSTIETPINGFNTMSINFEHKGSPLDFKTTISAQYPSNTYSSALEFSFTGTVAKGKFTISTPMKNFSGLTAEFTSDSKKWNDFQNNWSVEIMGKKMYGSSELKWTGKARTASIYVNIPEKYGAKVNFNGETTNFNTNTKIEYAGKEINVRNTFKATGERIETTLRVQTPYTGYENFEATMSHTGPAKQFRTELGIKTSIPNYDNFRVEVSHSSKDMTSIRTSAKIETPIPQWSSLSATFTHSGQPTDFNSILTFEKNLQKIEKTLKFKKSAIGLEIASTLTTPFNGYEQFEQSIKYTGMPSKRSAAVEVRTPFGNYNRIKAESSYEIQDNSFSHSSKIETSVPGYENFAYSFEMAPALSASGYTVRASVNTPFEQFKTTSFEATGAMSAKSQQFSIKLDTSVSKFDSFAVSATHEYVDPSDKTRGCSLKAEVRTPVEGFQSTTYEYAWNRDARTNKIQFSTKVDTSYPGYDSFSTSFHIVPNPSALNGRLEINTPFAKFSKFTVEADSKVENSKYTFSSRITTSIPNFESFSSSASFEGKLSAFTIKSEVNTPIEPYNRFAVTVIHKTTKTNIETSIQAETSVPKWERMGIQMKHASTPKGIKNTITIETPIEGFEKITTDFDHKGSDVRTISTSLNANAGLKQFAANFNHKIENSDLQGRLELTSNMRGYERFTGEYTHGGDSRNFRCTGKITTPFQKFPTISGELQHKRSASNLESSITFEYAPQKRYEGKVILNKPTGKSWEGEYEATVALKSPHSLLQDFSFSGKHTLKPVLRNGELTISHNGDRKVNVDYDYTEGPDYKIRISFTDPKPMEYRINFAKGEQTVNAEVNANWNMERSDSNVKLTVELTNQFESAQTTRKVDIGITTPAREAKLATSYIITATRFAHKTELQWSNEGKFTYDFDSTKALKRNQQVYDAKLDINSQIEITVNHKIINARQHVTEVGLKSSNRLVIKSDLTLLKQPSYKYILTVQHPKFSKDVTITTEGNIEPGKVYDGKLGIKYEDQVIDFAGRIADESSRSEMKYTAQCSLTHPKSSTDMQFKGEVKNSQKLVGGNMEYKWMAYDRSTKTFNLRAEHDKLQSETTIEIANPITTCSISGRQVYANHDEGKYRYVITSTCGSNTYRTEAELNRVERSIEVKFVGATENFLHVYAKYVSAYHMQFEVYRQQNGERINDILMALKLKEENIISGRLSVRPGLTSELQKLATESNLSMKLQRNWNEMSRDISEEMQYKLTAWREAAKPISQAAAVVGEEFGRYAKQVRVTYNEMYSRNDFYLRDITETTIKQLEIISDKIHQQMNVWSAQMSEWNKKMQYNIKSWSNTVSVQLKSARSQIKSAVHIAVDYVKDGLETVSTYWPYYSNIKARFADLNEYIKAKIAEMKEQVKNHPSIQPYLRRMPSVSSANYMIAFRNAAVDYVKSQIPEDMSDYAEDIWNNVGRRSEVRAILSWFKEYIKKVKYYYDYYEIDSITSNLVTDAYAHGWEVLKAQAVDLVDNYLQLDRTRWTTWDPQSGQYEFDVWMPLKMPSLQRLPEMPNVRQYFARVRGMVRHIMPENDWIFWDTWYRYKPSSDYMNIIPPFKTRAALVGNQHYMTFDRKFYEYAGECSYLLARDFINGKFSVAVNYERTSDGSAKKSITVSTGSRQIMIFPTGRVSIDGKRSELPLQIDGTTVTRFGNMLKLENSNGLSITCDLAHDRCTLNVTGWYYGKTGGMFGTYDNEPNNDMTLPNNQVAEDLESFADGWTLGQKCRKTNYAIAAPESIDNRRTALCAKYFKDSTSEFRNCFKIVSPEPFMTMCLNDIPTNINRVETEEDACNITAFYVDECRREGVPLRMPKVCVRCDMDNGRSFFEGDSVTLSETAGNVPQAADVVFMIQHAECNSAAVERVKNFVDEMDKAFRTRGIESVRYAIVGYGGPQALSQAHIHTIDGQIFNSREMFQYGIENLNIEKGSSNADGLLALRYALRMPYRSGASKTVVLIPCSTCKEQSISYAEVQQVLFEHDIRLHMLLDYNFEVKGKTPKSVIYYGADKDALYSRRDAGKKDVTGDRELRSQVAMPKDLCAALAEETDGSVFSSQQLVNRRPDEVKAFLDVFAHVIARKGEPSKCQRCECIVDEVGVGRSICRSCEDRMPLYKYLPYNIDVSESKETPSESTPSPPIEPPKPEPTKPAVEPPKPVPEKPVQPVKPQPSKPEIKKPQPEKPVQPSKPQPEKPKGNKPVVKPPVDNKPVVKPKPKSKLL